MFSIKYLLAALGAVSLVQAQVPFNRTFDVGKRQASQYMTTGTWPAHDLHFCTEANYGGSCTYFTAMDGQCMEIPVAYNDQVWSIYPPPANSVCVVYQNPYCTGYSYDVSSGSTDISAYGLWPGPPGYSPNGVTSIRCQARLNTQTTSPDALAHVVQYCSSSQCTYQISEDGVCTEIPQGAGFAGHIESFEPPQHVFCQLYNQYLCVQGSEQVVEYDNGDSIESNVLTYRCLTGDSP